MPVGTCRMAHLSLPNSELHVGVSFDLNTRIQELAAQPGVAILYPSPEAELPTSGKLPSALIVIDGTWSLARKVLRTTSILRGVPRLGLRPSAPGNYRIRKEPAPHCLSTIEATAQVLGELEGEPERFRQLLRPFDWMVEKQLEYIRAQLPTSRRFIRRAQRTLVETLDPGSNPRFPTRNVKMDAT